MIITYITGQEANEIINLYPDQYVSEKEKDTPKWIKTNMDYFANIAYGQYNKNEEYISKNYRLLKGILTPKDFYELEPEVRSFAETMLQGAKLPDLS